MKYGILTSMKRSDEDADPLNPLSVARKWLPRRPGLMLALTLGWTWFVFWYESTRGNHGDGFDATAAAADRGHALHPADNADFDAHSNGLAPSGRRHSGNGKIWATSSSSL